MSAIKELLGKEAHELTDEELSDLLHGNRPKPIVPKTKKPAKSSDSELVLVDFDDDEEGNELELDNLFLEDAEGRK
jgi:hypothetical protein